MSKTPHSMIGAPASFLRSPATLWCVLAVLPWLWFGVRGRAGLFDVVAIGLPAVCLVGLAVVVWAGVRRREALSVLPVLSLLLFAYVTIVGPGSSSPTAAPSSPVRFLNTNLESYWFSDNDLDWYLETHEAGVVVASEMQRSHRSTLRERFSHHVDDVIIEEQFRVAPDPDDESYRRFGFPSVGVYSEFPLTELPDTTGIVDGMPGFRVQVDLPTGPVVLYALHVPKPSFGSGEYQVSFSRHRSIAAKLAEAIEKETLPVVVLGDLNMTDRGGSYRSLRSADLTDGMLNTEARATSVKGFWWNLLRLRIDHLLLSPGLCSANSAYEQVRFTDHLFISADIGPCSPEGQ